MEPTFIFKDPMCDPNINDETSVIGNKYKIAKELCKDIKIVDIHNALLKIPMNNEKGM